MRHNLLGCYPENGNAPQLGYSGEKSYMGIMLSL